MIWYHTRVSTSRQSCFTITANDLVSHKGQHEQTALLPHCTKDLVSHKGQHDQTVLLHHYSQRSGIIQGPVRADSLASLLQPMIWYLTRVSMSRQSCFTITANDLVSHKGQHEQTALLHHYSQ